MNRTRRNVVNKAFVSGGVYNPNVTPVQQAPPVVAPSVVAPPVAVPPPPAISQPVEKSTPMLVKNESHVQLSDGGNGTDDTNAEMAFNNDDDMENGGKIPFKKIFQKRKKSSERTRDKKLRQNRQLRKSMLPKNALMALNEVKAIVTVNCKQYEGKGHSKMAAKNLACEKALRDYMIAKMTPRTKKTQKAGSEGEPEPMDINDGEAGESPEDDVPMLNLASFAIYKLFAEWEREGFIVPEMHPSAGSSSAQPGDQNIPAAAVIPKEPKKPPVRTELPPNWETMHPATLLCVMRPGLSYVDHGCIGEKPNIMQRLGVIVDNQEFTANGRSKKIARRNVAVNVCNSVLQKSLPLVFHVNLISL
ncbi:hypothetical protein ACLKA7_007356 [Drosophila subpalustris]